MQTLSGKLEGKRLIALMMEAARTSETLVHFYQTTRRYNPEDTHLLEGKRLFGSHRHRWEDNIRMNLI
jgi:hypothetical protein